MLISDEALLAEARELVRAEGTAVARVAKQLDEQFVRAVHMVAGCSGRIYVTGAGTSGAMAKRLAHLLATGSHHEISRPFDIDRFARGRLIDEAAGSGIAH